MQNRLWVERIRLTDFRNYISLSLDLDARPLVLTGHNGSGKTNLLEAVSLLTPGRGLRRAAFAELSRHDSTTGGWAVAARIHGLSGSAEIGTGLSGEGGVSGRIVRLDGAPLRGSGVLGDHMRALWLIPAMDGLFTGAAGDRRRFFDRLIQSLDPGYRNTLSRFEQAMRQRNRLLETGAPSQAEFEGLEMQMAETGVAIAAARLEIIERLRAKTSTEGMEHNDSPFPWATLALEGTLETLLEREAALDVEDIYLDILSKARPRDTLAKRTLEGPHRSDILVGHGPKAMPARSCSTGEQKALLTGLVLSHARLVKQQSLGRAPLILLDEIAAHLDELRRAALFEEILELGAQAWMTGTDAELFSALGDEARFVTLENGGIST